ncbi:unnamed protein product [Rhodiola kirilowii]
MTKRSADAIYGGQQINPKLEWEEKPCHLTDPMSLGRTVYTPGTAPMPLNSCKLAPKRVCIREFKVVDTSTDAMIRAKKIQASLSRPDMPSLIKFMHPSICSGGFSLGLSVNFCVHLPSEDCEVILEDEELQLYRTKYLAYKKTLSGGWRGFSIAHKIVVGDVVVFQLVAPCKMKVHIVRSSNSVEVKDVSTSRKAEERFGKPLAMVVYNEDNADIGNVTDESMNGSTASCDYEIRFSQSNITFREVSSFNDFHIVFNGLIIDCEFSKDMRLKYYQLCKSQYMFLHEHLLEGINCKLAAGIIIETVNIADAIRVANPSTPKEDVAVWNKTLKAVGGLGMNVRFLQERLNRQTGLMSDSDDGKCRSETGDALLVKLLEVQETAKKLHDEIEALRKANEQ